MTYSSAYAPGPYPWPLSRWGEGKVNIRFNPSPPLGERGERLISVHKAGEGVHRNFFAPLLPRGDFVGAY